MATTTPNETQKSNTIIIKWKEKKKIGNAEPANHSLTTVCKQWAIDTDLLFIDDEKLWFSAIWCTRSCQYAIWFVCLSGVAVQQQIDGILTAKQSTCSQLKGMHSICLSWRPIWLWFVTFNNTAKYANDYSACQLMLHFYLWLRPHNRNRYTFDAFQYVYGLCYGHRPFSYSPKKSSLFHISRVEIAKIARIAIYFGRARSKAQSAGI